MTVRYGIISAAQIVPRFVAGVRQSKAGIVTAIAASNLTKAQTMADSLSIPTAYGSYQKIYEDENVDVVYVATYNKGHYKAAKDALLAGKNVLVEKPFTLTWDEADELFTLAKKQGAFLMEAQKAVFLPATHFVKEQIETGAIGKIQYIRSVTSYPDVSHIRWFYSPEAGGGALRGAGTYPLQYLQYILHSAIDEVAGTALQKKEQADSQCDISLILENQVQANIFVTTNLDLPSQMTIYGEKGKIIIPDFWKAKEVMLEVDQQKEKMEFPYQSEFVYEVNHVNECLGKGLTESLIMTREMSMQTVELTEQLCQQWSN